MQALLFARICEVVLNNCCPVIDSSVPNYMRSGALVAHRPRPPRWSPFRPNIERGLDLTRLRGHLKVSSGFGSSVGHFARCAQSHRVSRDRSPLAFSPSAPAASDGAPRTTATSAASVRPQKSPAASSSGFGDEMSVSSHNLTPSQGIFRLNAHRASEFTSRSRPASRNTSHTVQTARQNSPLSAPWDDWFMTNTIARGYPVSFKIGVCQIDSKHAYGPELFVDMTL